MRLGLLPESDSRVITVKTELKGAFENEMEELVSRLEEYLIDDRLYFEHK